MLRFLIQIVDLVNFYDRYIHVKFYDFWNLFCTRSSSHKINEFN